MHHDVHLSVSSTRSCHPSPSACYRQPQFNECSKCHAMHLMTSFFIVRPRPLPYQVIAFVHNLRFAQPFLFNFGFSNSRMTRPCAVCSNMTRPKGCPVCSTSGNHGMISGSTASALNCMYAYFRESEGRIAEDAYLATDHVHARLIVASPINSAWMVFPHRCQSYKHSLSCPLIRVPTHRTSYHIDVSWRPSTKLQKPASFALIATASGHTRGQQTPNGHSGRE